MTLTGSRHDAHTGTVFVRAGEDIDDAHEGIGAITGCRRPAYHFDAVDVFKGKRQVAPIDLAKIRAVDRASVDQHLEPARITIAQSVVGQGADMAILMRHRKSRHQPKYVEQMGRARRPDHVTVDHRDSGGRIGHRLAQAHR